MTISSNTTHFDLVAIAASLGGIEALEQVLKAIPSGFPVPIVLVQHRTARSTELLPLVLSRFSRLPVKLAEAGELAQPGTLYVAPADHHLVLRPDRTFALHDGQRIRFVLSSANPLLESAVEALDGRVLAVVLTGHGADATDGVQAVKSSGGTVIAQDPRTARAFGMPGSAIASGSVDYVLPLEDIGPAIIKLVETGRWNEAA